MALYRLITENKNRDGIEDILKVFFTGSTIYEATGFWKNTKEQSLIIEIDDGNCRVGVLRDNYTEILRLAKVIKKLNNQDAVMVQQIQTRTEFI